MMITHDKTEVTLWVTSAYHYPLYSTENQITIRNGKNQSKY